MALMEGMRGRGATIVMITHDMRLIQQFADHVVVMAGGAAIYEGDPAQLFAEADILRRAALRPPAMTMIVDRLTARGLHPPAGIRTLEELVAATTLPESA
jgi:energy-coupling factor transport system ATP-binding protein